MLAWALSLDGNTATKPESRCATDVRNYRIIATPPRPLNASARIPQKKRVRPSRTNPHDSGAANKFLAARLDQNLLSSAVLMLIEPLRQSWTLL